MNIEEIKKKLLSDKDFIDQIFHIIHEKLLEEMYDVKIDDKLSTEIIASPILKD